MSSTDSQNRPSFATTSTIPSSPTLLRPVSQEDMDLLTTHADKRIHYEGILATIREHRRWLLDSTWEEFTVHALDVLKAGRWVCDVPRAMSIVRYLYRAATSRSDDTSASPNFEELVSCMDVVFLAGPGRHAFCFMPESLRRHVTAKVQTLLQDKPFAPLPRSELEASLASLSLLRPEVLDREEEAQLTDADRGTDETQAGRSLHNKFVKLMLADKHPAQITDKEQCTLFEELDNLLESCASPRIKLMSLCYASICQPKREYALGTSVLLKRFMARQTAQWKLDCVHGECALTLANNPGMNSASLLQLNVDKTSNHSIAGLNTDLYEYAGALEAKAYFYSKRRTENHSGLRSHGLDMICQKKQTLTTEIVKALLATPQIDNDKIAQGDSKEKTKAKMVPDFEAFLKLYKNDEDRRKTISALAYMIMESLISFCIKGDHLIKPPATVRPGSKDMKLDAPSRLQAILDALLTSKWLCQELLEQGDHAVALLVAFPIHSGTKSLNYSKNNAKKQARLDREKQSRQNEASPTAEAARSRMNEESDIASQDPPTGAQTERHPVGEVTSKQTGRRSLISALSGAEASKKRALLALEDSDDATNALRPLNKARKADRKVVRPYRMVPFGTILNTDARDHSRPGADRA